MFFKLLEIFISGYYQIILWNIYPHMSWQKWEEIYADWDAGDPLRYYWQAWDLNVQES